MTLFCLFLIICRKWNLILDNIFLKKNIYIYIYLYFHNFFEKWPILMWQHGRGLSFKEWEPNHDQQIKWIKFFSQKMSQFWLDCCWKSIRTFHACIIVSFRKKIRWDVSGYIQSNTKQMDQSNATRQDPLRRDTPKPMDLITKKRSLWLLR